MSFSGESSQFDRMAAFCAVDGYGAPLIIETREPNLPVEYRDPSDGDPNSQPIAKLHVVFNPDSKMEANISIRGLEGKIVLTPDEIESVAIDHQEAAMLPLIGREIGALSIGRAHDRSIIGVSRRTRDKGFKHIVYAEKIDPATVLYELYPVQNDSMAGEERAVKMIMTKCGKKGDYEYVVSSNVRGRPETVVEMGDDHYNSVVRMRNYPELEQEALETAHQRAVGVVDTLGMTQFEADQLLLRMTKTEI